MAVVAVLVAVAVAAVMAAVVVEAAAADDADSDGVFSKEEEEGTPSFSLVALLLCLLCLVADLNRVGDFFLELTALLAGDLPLFPMCRVVDVCWVCDGLKR